MKYFTIFAFLILFFTSPAQAQDDEARIQILKSQIEGFLENQKAMAIKNHCKLDITGTITVEKASGYYALTLPPISYTDSKGIKSNIGMVAINAAPQPNNEWKISLAVPTPINSYNASGTAQFKTDIETQNATGVWNEKLGHFTSVNSTFGKIHLNDLKNQETVTINELTFNSSMNEKDPDAYTGTATAIAKDISFSTGIIPLIQLKTNLADRAFKNPMTKEEIKNRPQSNYPDFYNIFSLLFGAPERVEASIQGLDDVNTKLQQSMITAKPDERAKFLQSIIAVSAMSGMGKPSPSDPSTKLYEIVFGQDGNVTFNGTDVKSLMEPTESAKANKPAPR